MKVGFAQLLWSTSLLYLVCKSTIAAPMVSIGQHVAIHIEAEAKSQYMSNITMSTNKSHVRDDMILTFAPGVELALFESSPAIDIFFTAKREFIHFLDEDYFNEEPWMLSFHTGYSGDLFNLMFDWSAIESLHNINSSRNVFANENDDIVIDKNESFGVNFHVAFSPKTGLRSGVTLKDIDFKFAKKSNPSGLVDHETLLIPLDLFYEITPKLESIIGYRYRKILLKNFRDYNDHYINFGFVGDVTEKSDLRLTIGYQNRGQKGAKDKHSFTANLNCKYKATERVHFNVGGNRDFGVGSSIGAPSIEITGANLGLDIFASPSLMLRTTAQGMYSKYSTGRKDLGGRASTTLRFHPLNTEWEIYSSYRYDWNRFKQYGGAQQYKNHNITVGSSWRY